LVKLGPHEHFGGKFFRKRVFTDLLHAFVFHFLYRLQQVQVLHFELGMQTLFLPKQPQLRSQRKLPKITDFIVVTQVEWEIEVSLEIGFEVKCSFLH
jgi:hypothetical protein